VDTTSRRSGEAGEDAPFVPEITADIVADIASRAPEIERARRLPADLIASLKDAGCLRMLVPTAYGGDARALPDVLRTLETLARADGATGWVVGQVASAQLILAFFPSRALEDIYANGPDVFATGAVAPKGRITRDGVVDGDGWRVTGQWPFVSGCEDASWIYVQSMVIQQQRLQVGPDDVPALRLAVFPAREVEILDTWSVSGLRGTGSHDVRLQKTSCPDWRTVTLGGGLTRADGTIFSIPPLDQGGLYIAAVALGIARGALDDVATLAAAGKRPAFSRDRLAASPVFQDRLGDAFMQWQSARALLYSQAEAAWIAVRAGRAPALHERAVLRATSATTIAAAARVVDEAYTLAGGSALFDASPLQRRFRDVHAATQHTYAGRYYLGVVGGLLAGDAPDPALF